MARCAVVSVGVVVNVVLADTALAAEKGWIVTDTAGLGWTWNGVTFTAPPPPLPPPPRPPNPLKAIIDAVIADPTVPLTVKTLLAAWKAQL